MSGEGQTRILVLDRNGCSSSSEYTLTTEGDGGYCIKEHQAPYSIHFDDKMDAVSWDNTEYWNGIP